MTEIGAFEAKTHFSKLLERANRGEEIIITRRGEPFATLGPIVGSRDVETSKTAFRTMRESAKALAGPRITLEEILAWKEEGRH